MSRQDHGSAIITLPSGEEVGAAVHLEADEKGSWSLAVNFKPPGSASWEWTYKRHGTDIRRTKENS